MTLAETPPTKLSDADWERMRARLIELFLLHDRNAACAMVVDAVRDRLPFTDIYLTLLPLLNSRRVELLDHPRLTTQLCNLERRITLEGGAKISAVLRRCVRVSGTVVARHDALT